MKGTGQEQPYAFWRDPWMIAGRLAFAVLVCAVVWIGAAFQLEPLLSWGFALVVGMVGVIVWGVRHTLRHNR